MELILKCLREIISIEFPSHKALLRRLAIVNRIFNFEVRKVLFEEITINSYSELISFDRWTTGGVFDEQDKTALVKRLKIDLNSSILCTQFYENEEEEQETESETNYEYMPPVTVILDPGLVVGRLIRMLNRLKNLEFLVLITEDNQLKLDQSLIDDQSKENKLEITLPKLEQLKIDSSFLHLQTFTNIDVKNLSSLIVHGSFIQTGGEKVLENSRRFFEGVGPGLKSLRLMDADSSISNILPHLSSLSSLHLNRITQNNSIGNRNLLERLPSSLTSLSISLGGEALANVLRLRSPTALPLLAHFFIEKLNELVILSFLPPLETLSIRYSRVLSAALDRLVIGQVPFQKILLGKDLFENGGVRTRCKMLGIEVEMLK